MIFQKFSTLFVVFVYLPLALHAQDTHVNVNSFTAPELQSVPLIDGDLTDSCWEGVSEIKVDKLGDAPQSAKPGDLDVFVKSAWDQETNALYFAVRILDNVFIDLYGYGSPLDTQGWKNERFEIMLDGMNTGKNLPHWILPITRNTVLIFPIFLTLMILCMENME